MVQIGGYNSDVPASRLSLVSLQRSESSTTAMARPTV
jgi:hypothetical protein